LYKNEQGQFLRPKPIPHCNGSSQALENLLFVSDQTESSTQRWASRGEGIACFHPALVFHPRHGKGYSIAVAADSEEIEARELIR
jgi:hypothetical protein